MRSLPFRPARQGVFLLLAAVILADPFLLGCSPASLRPPLDLRLRDSAFGYGKVLVIENPTKASIYNIRVMVRAKTGESISRDAAYELSPKSSVEMGWIELDLWQPEPGETFYVFAHGYDAPLALTIPD